MAQSRFYSANAQPTVLTANITPTSTIIQVAQTVGFPATTPFILALDYGNASEEVVLCTAVAGLSLTVTRGYDSTSATAHNAGAAVRHTWTAMDGNDSRAHEGSNSGVHGVVGNVVGTTDTQTLSNKTLNSPTFTGSVVMNSPTITGTVAGNATYSGITVSGTTTNTGTVSGGAVNPATVAATGAITARTVAATATAVADIPLTSKGFAGQTGHLLSLQDSASTELFFVKKGGGFMVTNGDGTDNAMILKGNAAQSARMLVVQDSASTTLFDVGSTGNTSVAGTFLVSGNATFNGSTFSGTANMKAYAGIGGINFAFKTANQAITSSTALTNDTHLVLPVAANATYILDGFFDYDGVLGPNNGDIKFDWTVPAGATMTWSPFGNPSNDVTQKLNSNQGTATTVLTLGTYGTGGQHTSARPFGYIAVAGTAGNLQLRWAQNVSNATSTTMYTGSWIRLQRVA